jgi:hypothetical protein
LKFCDDVGHVVVAHIATCAFQQKILRRLPTTTLASRWNVSNTIFDFLDGDLVSPAAARVDEGAAQPPARFSRRTRERER